ncbi:histo-blood group ABO system transferase-like isoform X2 [Bombina bombina]|uniref:histo-blood group ABO system transferase-like isoform X2 n=1 Tax=Bombina bombina TaxID=8345 RepID=UPI00235A4A6E|nr:histo-blood group ABO system transferase-like isoform X2 [Bombina bombina]
MFSPIGNLFIGLSVNSVVGIHLLPPFTDRHYTPLPLPLLLCFSTVLVVCYLMISGRVSMGEKSRQKTCIITAAVILFLFSLLPIWHMDYFSSSRWPLQYSFSCTLNGMIYDKPNALVPQRTDVAMITPWLAPIVWNGSYNIDILNEQFHQKGVRIGLTVFAIKKYIVFIKTFIETAEQFFMVGNKVNYYVFTDRPTDVSFIPLKEGRRLVVLEVPSYKRWQEVTMRRMEMIRNYSQQLFINEVDYLVCVDVDMKFSDEVGVEILSDVFGTLHPSFYGASREQFTHERRPQSEAFIPVDEGDFYYAGGCFGGTVEEVYKLTNFCHNAMMTDKGKNIEAIWHDESYLNKYFLYHKPTKVLSPEYLWNNNFGGRNFLKRRRFVAVTKNNVEIRKN